MSFCSSCHATPADFYSAEGDVVCRPCFAAGDQQSADARAQASLADTGIAGVRYATGPTSPRAVLVAGAVLTAVGLGFCVGWPLLTGTFSFRFLLVFGAGIATLARGHALRRA